MISYHYLQVVGCKTFKNKCMCGLKNLKKKPQQQQTNKNKTGNSPFCSEV